MADKVGSFSDRSIIAFRDRMTGGGARSNLFEVNIELPSEKTYTEFDNGTPEGQKVSTTMAVVRLLRNLMKSEIGEKIVPIITDEGRTNGMDQ